MTGLYRCFYINLPLGGAVAVLLGFVRVPDQIEKPKAMAVLRDIHTKLDLIGFVVFAPAAIMLLLAVQWGGNQYPWDSSVVIGLICGSVATFVVWGVWNNHKKDGGLIPFPMLRKRIVWMSCVSQATLASGLFIVSYYVSGDQQLHVPLIDINKCSYQSTSKESEARSLQLAVSFSSRVF